MIKLDELTYNVKGLEKEAEDIEKKVTNFLSYNFEWCYANDFDTETLLIEDHFRERQRKHIRSYQIWYSKGEMLIKEYLYDRRNEFTREYDEILSLLQLREGRAKKYVMFIIKEFTERFDIQRNLLLSLPEVFKIQNLNLMKMVSADLVESELDEAKLLLDHDFTRAAGAVAGVALERHLKTLCEISTPPVEYTIGDTLDPLATKLYKEKHLDLIELKNIQYLASIRNKCDHAKEEDPTEKEVNELIIKTDEFIKKY